MNNLRSWRRARGLTQAALARKSGVSQQVISKIETGVIREPSHRAAVKLARALRVNPQAIAEFHISASGNHV